MKKSEKILFTVFKFIYFISLAAVAVTYIGNIFDKTATYCSVTATDWLSLTAMSFAFGYIAKREKKAASQN